jgi:uncharacterized protein (TIGR03000 family)
MYSVVLATMLTVGGGSTTAWCHGCHGCHGYSYCHGYSSCHGCFGGWFGCHGYHGCHGCHGCWGGYAGYACYGSSFYGCTGCCGGVVAYPYVGCCGCCGGAVYVPPVVAPVVAVPYASIPSYSAPVIANANLRADGYDAKPQAARITVSLPSNARLWVDNVKCPLVSGQRSFKTPALNPGTEYFYTLRMEADRDGQTVSENRRVFVAAGRSVNVDFNAPATVTAQR